MKEGINKVFKWCSGHLNNKTHWIKGHFTLHVADYWVNEFWIEGLKVSTSEMHTVLLDFIQIPQTGKHSTKKPRELPTAIPQSHQKSHMSCSSHNGFELG